MMPILLEIKFFSINDIFLVPLCLVLMFIVIRNRANNHTDPFLRKLYYSAFSFRILGLFAYTFITEFYFGGGDTNLYYQGVKDMRTAISDNIDNLWVAFFSPSIQGDNPLTPYFMYDNYAYDITVNYMRSPANFFVPRMGLLPSFVFFNSYLCMAFCFSFFALGGAMRLFKLFYYYYPKARAELALATLFLPSVVFWSSGLMKDTICFGAVGYLIYGVFNIFVRRRNVFWSIVWVLIASYILYVVKTYIFLVLLLALSIWLFAEMNKVIKEKTLRRIFAFMTFVIGFTLGFFLLQYFTSDETFRQYQLENIASSAEYQRSNYEKIDVQLNQQSSYYSINSSNPVSLVINSIGAVFYRPFIWEVNSAAAVLSALEATAFLLLTLHLFFKRGIKGTFSSFFSDPRTLMCFVFAIIFAIGVGASTANFGALSRYKIPCMPIYMIMILLTYRNTKLDYPKWFNWVLRKIKLN